MIPNETLNSIEADLEGTAQDISQVAEDYQVDIDALNKAIGERQNIFLCPNCSWWCSMSEVVGRCGEDICEDCAND